MFQFIDAGKYGKINMSGGLSLYYKVLTFTNEYYYPIQNLMMIQTSKGFKFKIKNLKRNPFKDKEVLSVTAVTIQDIPEFTVLTKFKGG